MVCTYVVAVRELVADALEERVLRLERRGLEEARRLVVEHGRADLPRRVEPLTHDVRHAQVRVGSAAKRALDPRRDLEHESVRTSS